MKRIEPDLLLVLALTLLLLGAALGPLPRLLRLVLGVPFILFLPGYALLAALLPRRDDLEPLPRFALSFAASLALVILAGFLLDKTPWGIGLRSVALSLALPIAAACGIAWLRRQRLPAPARFQPLLNLPSLSFSGRGGERALAGFLLASLLGAVGLFGYALTRPPGGETYTEFYILRPDGKAHLYPVLLSAGDTRSVLVGIINRERRETRYRVVLTVGGEKLGESEPVVLPQGGKWEKEMSFTPRRAGRQKLEFLLYKEDERAPYRSTYLWLEVPS